MTVNDLGHLAVIVERIEGKIDRMNDRVKLTESKVEALLDVVTGQKSGAHKGLVVKVHDLEQRVDRIESALNNFKMIEKQVGSVERKLDDVLEMQREHPSLLYLLRFQTRRTLFWIVVLFLLLSIWWVSGWRQPILEFFGLPIF